MKNFFFTLVFIFLAFLAWQYYSQANFDFKKIDKLNLDNLKEINIFKSETEKVVEEEKEYSELKINEDLTVPKEVVVCLVGARDNLETAMTASYSQSEEFLNGALDEFNQCQKESDTIDDCYQDYLSKQNTIVETLKLERVNINNAYQFNLQLCWPNISDEDLELIFNKI